MRNMNIFRESMSDNINLEKKTNESILITGSVVIDNNKYYGVSNMLHFMWQTMLDCDNWKHLISKMLKMVIK